MRTHRIVENVDMLHASTADAWRCASTHARSGRSLARPALAGPSAASGTLRRMKRRLVFLAGAGVALMGASCMTPGQYHVFRVASTTAEQSAGCFPGGPGPDLENDSSTLRTGQTFAIYAADNETVFLDFETFSLAGTKDGSDYAFSGESVDVSTQGDITITVTSVTTVDAEIKGNKISGTSTLDVTSTCVGASCPGSATSQCISTVSFQGAKVKGVDLEHTI